MEDAHHDDLHTYFRASYSNATRGWDLHSPRDAGLQRDRISKRFCCDYLSNRNGQMPGLRIALDLACVHAIQTELVGMVEGTTFVP